MCEPLLVWFTSAELALGTPHSSGPRPHPEIRAEGTAGILSHSGGALARSLARPQLQSPEWAVARPAAQRLGWKSGLLPGGLSAFPTLMRRGLMAAISVGLPLAFF